MEHVSDKQRHNNKYITEVYTSKGGGVTQKTDLLNGLSVNYFIIPP
jgi:hypothetical protein